MGDVQAHHSETGGVGMKGPDLSCIPLCHYHHNAELHQKGELWFEDKHRVNVWWVVIITMRAYIEGLEDEEKDCQDCYRC
jgi:hypothetical protein